MQNLLNSIQIQVNDSIYLKDPNSSDLGKKIVSEGLMLIDEIGLEQVTFKKLATRLGTTETSIYRYFDSKFKLLVYLTSWYWGWMEYQLVFSTMNIANPTQKLQKVIEILCNHNVGAIAGGMNLGVLSSVVVSESSKAYLTKAVDEANKVGFYIGYKRVVQRMSDIMLEVNPDFSYPHTLSSTIIEGIHHQVYFAQHLPSLTDIPEQSNKLSEFYTLMAFAALNEQNQNA